MPVALDRVRAPRVVLLGVGARVRLGRGRDERDEAFGERQTELVRRVLRGARLVARGDEVADHLVVVGRDALVVLRLVALLEDVLERAVDLGRGELPALLFRVAERLRARLQEAAHLRFQLGGRGFRVRLGRVARAEQLALHRLHRSVVDRRALGQLRLFDANRLGDGVDGGPRILEAERRLAPPEQALGEARVVDDARLRVRVDGGLGELLGLLVLLELVVAEAPVAQALQVAPLLDALRLEVRRDDGARRVARLDDFVVLVHGRAPVARFRERGRFRLQFFNGRDGVQRRRIPHFDGRVSRNIVAQGLRGHGFFDELAIRLFRLVVDRMAGRVVRRLGPRVSLRDVAEAGRQLGVRAAASAADRYCGTLLYKMLMSSDGCARRIARQIWVRVQLCALPTPMGTRTSLLLA
mmetsp:Transcript_21981/g.68824  ORF Transcript_21981/g.68824 Transcript_21981/m.68824 type:complete len:412 (+) Transcript_21981:764-1999(+)